MTASPLIEQACRANIEQLEAQLPIAHSASRAGLLPPGAPDPRPDALARLVALTRRVHHDLEILAYPKDEWVVPRHHPAGHHVYDVVIVGAGQCGLAVAFGLLRERVSNILVLDRALKGREGPWITYSRMWTLRSPKHVTGPDLGIPSLAPRSWFEAVFGEEGWKQLGKWPRQVWQAYLNWYRAALDLPVRNEVEVRSFELDGEFVRIVIDSDMPLVARKVVLATGLEGIGGWHVPAVVREKLPPTAWTLCSNDIDSLAWTGKKIAVLGAGATAWDRTADLLELGAACVAMYMRRPQILTANPFRYLEKAGYLRHYASMPDADKWRWIQAIFAFGQPPTQDGVDRCAAFETFSLHPSATWTDVVQTPEGIRVSATDGSTTVFDHLFIGCGFSMDPRNRPELAVLADNMATWTDVFTAPADQPDPWLATYPYLNRDLSFVEKIPGRTPVLAHMFCFNYGATVTNAHSGASLSGLRYGIEPLIHGITHALWSADEPVHFARVSAWADVDTDPSSLDRHRRWPET